MIESANLEYTGLETLQRLSIANRYNKWMYDSIKRFCFDPLLEIGSGIGSISGFFIDDEQKIMLSDTEVEFCNFLSREFQDNSNLLGIVKIDLVHKDFDSVYSNHFGKFSSVFSLNVVEHIDDDNLALKNAAKFLKPGGNLVILVPAYQILFNSIDRSLGHFRRYTKSGLTSLFKQNDFEIIHKKYFNLVGIIAWLISGAIQNNKSIPPGQLKLYNFFVPLFKMIDKMIFHSAGLSVIVTGRKITR